MDKGSVCINGVSLTVVEPVEDTFKVAIIPYTYEHTNFNALRPGSRSTLSLTSSKVHCPTDGRLPE